MIFDYSKLNGRIVEKFGTRTEFAKALNLSARSLSLKLNNERYWKSNEILRACELLEIQKKDIATYFFKLKVH